jgi:L-fuconolactonase
VAAVVGWIDFEKPEQRATLERLAAHPKFVGVRPMIQDLPDDDWMFREDIQWAFEAIVGLDLTFDALGVPRHTDRFRRLMARHPDMRVVLDHCMKPAVSDPPVEGFDQWVEDMRRIAGETGAFCKLSGLVTEAAPGCTVEKLRPYVEVVLDAFGAERVMWGSDWPVALLRCEYTDWFEMAQRLTCDLTEVERHRVFGGTAAAFYQLS